MEFNTWERIIQNKIKTSILDHNYAKDSSTINNIRSIKPLAGDHVAVLFEIDKIQPNQSTQIRRCWKNYSKSLLLTYLSQSNWESNGNSTQDIWYEIENKLIRIVDVVAPMVEFKNNLSADSQKTTATIKHKLNLRKRLLKKLRTTNNKDGMKSRINNISQEIKQHYREEKIKTSTAGSQNLSQQTLADSK